MGGRRSKKPSFMVLGISTGDAGRDMEPPARPGVQRDEEKASPTFGLMSIFGVKMRGGGMVVVLRVCGSVMRAAVNR